jgi:hypothetical protein
MKKISSKAGTVCLWICCALAITIFCYMLVFEGVNVAW